MEMGTDGPDLTAAGESSEEGWFTDPYGLHEARWLSVGRPTELVRDRGTESYDQPPDTPFVRSPVRIVSPAELLPSTLAVVTDTRTRRRPRFSLTRVPGLDFHIDFMVGTSEKHRVTYDWGQFWGTTTILVDGQEVVRKLTSPLSFRLTWRHDILVGSTELHRFVVEHTAPWFWGGLRVHTFLFFVDDQLVYTY
jgi:hypothetical protein